MKTDWALVAQSLRKGPGGASPGFYVMTQVETVSEML
jgi:hypothetical protein